LIAIGKIHSCVLRES